MKIAALDIGGTSIKSEIKIRSESVMNNMLLLPHL